MMRTITSRLPLLGLAAVLVLAAGCNNPVDNQHNVLRAVGVVITDLNDSTLFTTEGAGPLGWVGAPMALRAGEELPVRIYFISPAGQRFQLPLAGAEHTLRVDFNPAGLASYQGQTEQGVFRGLMVGSGTVTIHVWHGVHADFSTNPLPLGVTP